MHKIKCKHFALHNHKCKHFALHKQKCKHFALHRGQCKHFKCSHTACCCCSCCASCCASHTSPKAAKPRPAAPRMMMSLFWQSLWYRSHFGSRYKSGPCFTAGLFAQSCQGSIPPAPPDKMQKSQKYRNRRCSPAEPKLANVSLQGQDQIVSRLLVSF
jgi:hypothetical protein